MLSWEQSGEQWYCKRCPNGIPSSHETNMHYVICKYGDDKVLYSFRPDEYSFNDGFENMTH